MEQEVTFEALLERHRIAVERYINFRMPSSFDADDVTQETYLAAYIGFPKLRRKELFKPWILSIAKNQCNLWFRRKYGNEAVPLEAVAELEDASFPLKSAWESVDDIMRRLPRESAEILELTVSGYKQSQIALCMGIPVGTVKSRLHYAKERFRSICTPEQISMFAKGRKLMTKKDYTCGFPAVMPTLTIKESTRPFVEIKCEEEGLIIPRVGNKNSEATYRYPDMKLALVSTCYVPETARVNGADGVKVCRDTYSVRYGKLYKNECVWVEQLTDEYSRCLAILMRDGETDVQTYIEEGFDIKGSDAVRGNPLLIKENPPKTVDGDAFTFDGGAKYTLGCFDVTLGEKTFETIRYFILYGEQLREYYVDMNGRVILLRCWESAKWIQEYEYYSEEFKKGLSDSLKLLVNGVEFRAVHWQVCECAI